MLPPVCIDWRCGRGGLGCSEQQPLVDDCGIGVSDVCADCVCGGQASWLTRILKEVHGDGDAGVVLPHADRMIVDSED